MPDDERIEQLELEIKVLRTNNKGLKAKIDELWNKLDEKNTELEKEKEKNKIFEDVINNREYTWKQKYEETFNHVTDDFISKDKIKAKIEEYNNLREECIFVKNGVQCDECNENCSIGDVQESLIELLEEEE